MSLLYAVHLARLLKLDTLVTFFYYELLLAVILQVIMLLYENRVWSCVTTLKL